MPLRQSISAQEASRCLGKSGRAAVELRDKQIEHGEHEVELDDKLDGEPKGIPTDLENNTES